MSKLYRLWQYRRLILMGMVAALALVPGLALAGHEFGG